VILESNLATLVDSGLRPSPASRPELRLNDRFNNPSARRLFALSPMLLAALPLAALEMTLDWRVGKETAVFRESISPRGSGYAAILPRSRVELTSESE
jgi:hypothetical protein